MKTEFPEWLVDECLDRVLRASGSALAHYTNRDKLRSAMQVVLNRGAAAAQPPAVAVPTSERKPMRGDADFLNRVWGWDHYCEEWSHVWWNSAGFDTGAYSLWKRTNLKRPQSPEAGHE